MWASSRRESSASITYILARRRNRLAGSSLAFVVLLSALIAVGASACGGVRATPVAASAPTPSPPPKVGVDERLPLRAWWNLSKVSRTGDDVYQASMSPQNSAARGTTQHVQMTGLGFPYVAPRDGHTLAGPGVDVRWDNENNEYQVSFQFAGTELGLSVFSTGGRWKALVNGVAVGGGTPRSAGSSFAYHVLDLDFSDAGARSRTITFELSGGAWLSGIGTDAPSDNVSAPPARGITPSVYWLGDSYVVGSGAQYPGFDDLVHIASRQAGLSNVTVDALGGTGYRRSNPAAKFPDYLSRAKMNLRAGKATPDIIVVGGSINDDIYPAEQVEKAASALYAYLARALPRAKVIVVPFTDGYPVPSGVQQAIDGVLAAARSAPNVVGVLDLPAQVLAERRNEPIGRLSSALTSTTVLYHPSPAGHKLYGEIIGRFIAKILRQQVGKS